MKKMQDLYKLSLGALAQPGGGVAFTVWAPHAAQVAVKLLGKRPRSFPMQRGADGTFTAVIAEARPGTEYFYVLDGDRDRPDPASRAQPRGVHGPSQVVAPPAFAEVGWRGLPLHEYVIYELHIGTFTPEGTFAAAIAKLPYLRALGITAVEIMPVAAFPGTRNWGYDGVALFAPQASYGGLQGLCELVAACHRHGLACILDVVYNHLGPEGNYLPEFAPYFSPHYRTAWGEALNFDGPQSAGVRRFFIENAVYFLRDCHFDALRLDAADSLFDTSARHVLAELQHAAAAIAAQRGRPAYLIAESDLNDPRLLHPPERGGYGLAAQWSDDFHHALHAVLTRDRHGYFADFGRLVDVEKALNQGFVYDGQPSTFRSRRHGFPPAGCHGWQFVICTQNHDQIANGSQGRRLGTLVTLEQQKLAACVLLLSPNVPLLFMGQEYGETAPFHYFVNHQSADLLESVRRGRERDFASFRFAGEFAVPHDEATFAACKLDFSATTRSPHAELLALYRELLALRRAQQCLHNGRQDLTRAISKGTYLVLERRDPDGGMAYALFNFSDSLRRIPLRGLQGSFRLALSSAAPRYGGPAKAPPPRAVLKAAPGKELRVPCPPWSALLYLRDAGS
jgi:maltooligosyltrehalose trehalohydrolase